jgi:hypothetical protein
MTGINVISIVFQNSKSKECSCSKDQKRRRSRGFAQPLWCPGCDGVVLPGIRYTVTQMNRMCPRPKGGRAGVRGAGGVQYNKKLIAGIGLYPFLKPETSAGILPLQWGTPPEF